MTALWLSSDQKRLPCNRSYGRFLWEINTF